MKPYGKRVSRGRTTGPFVDNGCPCCKPGEQTKNSATRQQLDRELEEEIDDALYWKIADQLRKEEEDRIKEIAQRERDRKEWSF